MQNKQHLWNIKHKHMHYTYYVTQVTTASQQGKQMVKLIQYLK